MKLRGYVAVAVSALSFVAMDVFQRLVIAPWVRLRPSRRISVLGPWQHFVTWAIRFGARIGGASFPPPPVMIPAEPGHLILMNHQSVFDVVVMVPTIDRGYTRMVTRQRYSRSVPLISHHVRLYDFPLVDPTASRTGLRESLAALERIGRETDVPILVFPEGTRTRDGEIGRFKTAGLTRLLAARDWTVHLLVCDGFWRAARLADVFGEMGRLEGRLAHAGTLHWTDPTADPKPFIAEARRMMVDTLAEMRGERPST